MIKRHGAVYWLDLRIAGKRVRRSLNTGEHGLAIERAREIKASLEQESARRDIKIDDFAAKYLEWAWSHKPASADREQQRLEKIKSFFASLGLAYLTDITPYHLEQLRAWLKTRPVKQGDKELEVARGQATINRYMQLLRGMFYKAIDWEIYSKPNPVKELRFYREQPEIRPLSKDDVSKILEAARKISKNPKSELQKAFVDIVILALNTGLRKSEILNLRWKDMKDDEIEVVDKGNRRRMVPLNTAAREAISRQPRRTEYVFHIPNRSQHDLLRRTIIQVRKATGVDFHFHLLRHFFTTTLIEKGVDIVTISSILGHSKMTTSLIYSHTDKEKKKVAVEKIF